MMIVGGGATGVGVAADAAARGYEVLLLEQHDFGKGTSSRSWLGARGPCSSTRAATPMAPRVAELMANALGRDAAWQEQQVAALRELAKRYVLPV